MKKTLLATAIAGAIAASGMAVTNAQAATVYDQDGTKLDIYGRIAMGIRGGGPEYNDADELIDNGEEFVDVYSRLGLNLSHQVTSDLTAFGRLEWRFRGDERYTDSGFTEIRQSYLGLRSDTFGTVQAGNFDSFYNQFVSIPFDVYIDRGLEFAGHPKQSRGDSVAYMTPNLEGFQVGLQAKHYSTRGELEPSEGSTVAAQGAMKYEIDNLRLALGVVDDVVEGGGNDEILYGATVSYEFIPGFSGRLGYETRSDNDVEGGGYDIWGLGASYSVNQWAFNADIYDVSPDNDESRTSWALGGYYNVSSAFQVFLELQQADQPSIDVTLGGGDTGIETADGDDMYWLTGARYFF
ncbi:porin [Halomonas sp. 3H]|uniref:porin n=1 Tax=Halomonas sp. 3H TaxID=2952527 RepID=UPI0020B8F536|nr:porin [Halomonas sp. 3H]